MHWPVLPQCCTLHAKLVQSCSSSLYCSESNQEVHSGKFEKYNYGSSEANRQHYNQVCDGRRKEGRVGRGGDGGEGRRKLLQC